MFFVAYVSGGVKFCGSVFVDLVRKWKGGFTRTGYLFADSERTAVTDVSLMTLLLFNFLFWYTVAHHNSAVILLRSVRAEEY